MTSTTDNLVSIIIPCFNSEEWIAESIESALSQTWSAKEVIVIDDGSSDHSREVIESFRDQIRAEFGPNRGGCAARNRGLALARGRWIQYLDSDDVLLPNCLERKLAEHKDGSTVVCCGIEFMPFVLKDGESGGPAAWLHSSHTLDSILAYGSPQTSAPLHARENLNAVGGFREKLRHAQEFDLHLRMAIKLGLNFRSHGETGVRIRPHSKSVSRSAGAKMHIAIAEVLLHGSSMLQQRGQLCASRRKLIAQRATIYARRAAKEGALHEAGRIVARARHLSREWYKTAYARDVKTVLLHILGFTLFETLSSTMRNMRRKLS